MLMRFKVTPDGCWQWSGHFDRDGYARGRANGRGSRLVHRFIYQELFGPIPEDQELDHLCRNRACVNPARRGLPAPTDNQRKGSMSVTVSPHQTPEFMGSIGVLSRGLRSARAQLRRDLGSGRVSVLDVLADPPPEVEALLVYELVSMCQGVGRVKMTRLGRRAAIDRVNLFVRVDRCSQWTRDWLGLHVPQMRGW